MLSRLYDWYGKRAVWGVAGLIVVLGISGLVLSQMNTEVSEAEKDQYPLVRVSSVNALSSGQNISLIGSVEAVDEVALESEASGRITRVNVGIGDRVRTGQTIATIENASEYAAVLQAEGAYEAAVAVAATSDLGVEEAKSDAVSTYRSAYSTVSGIVLNTVDDVFAQPRHRTPGLLIDGSGLTLQLNDDRYELNGILEEWRKRSVSIGVEDDIDALLHEAREDTFLVRDIVDTIIRLIPKQSKLVYSESRIEALQTEFTAAQASLNATVASIDSSIKALAQAEVSGSGGAISAADAQVKQALGSLRAAQANYAKTIISTPISGTVNSLSVRTGDYVSVQSPIGVVANNDALLITTSVNESERDFIAVGMEVVLDGSAAGTIARIAPAVDATTGKITVEIESTDVSLKNGDVVSIDIVGTDSEASAVLRLPITALKFTSNTASVFTVEDGRLVAHEVQFGNVSGDTVVIEGGIDPSWEIVVDARGLNDGMRVTIAE